MTSKFDSNKNGNSSFQRDAFYYQRSITKCLEKGELLLFGNFLDIFSKSLFSTPSTSKFLLDVTSLVSCETQSGLASGATISF